MTTYDAVHNHLGRLRGKASDYMCPCGRPAQEWAYQHNSGEPLYSPKGQVYSENLDDYLAMCRSCHRMLDWEATPERLEKAAAAGVAAIRELWRADSEFVEKQRARLAKGCAGFLERINTDPEFAERQRARLAEVGAKGHAALRERYLTDPAFVEKQIARLAKGRAAQRERLQTDPEFAAARRSWAAKGAATINSRRRRCLACGLVTTPGNIGNHQRSNGHDLIGYSDVPNREESAR